MDIVVKNEITSNDQKSALFLGLDNHDIESIKTEVSEPKKDSLDIVIDFRNIENLNGLLNQVNNMESANKLKRTIYDDYLSITLLNKIKELGLEIHGRLSYIDLNVKETELTSPDLSSFLNGEFIDIYEVLYLLKQLQKNNKLPMRVHLFLDYIDDPKLQESINYLMNSQEIKVIAYSTKRELLTNKLPSGLEINSESITIYEKTTQVKTYA